MLRKQDYNTFTLIAKSIVVSGLTTGTEVTPQNSLEGEVFVTDKSNKILAAYPAKGAVRIIQSMGPTAPLKIVDIADVTNAKVSWKKFKRPVQKTVVIGYNPVSTVGMLPVANNTSFFINLKKRDNDAANRSQASTAVTGQFLTSSASTQAELAHGLANQLFKNTLLEAINHGTVGQQQYVGIEVVSDATITPAINTGAVRYGSKLIKTTAAPAVAAGQEIQILGDSYMVAAIDMVSNTITLAVPYRGNDIAAAVIDDAFTTPGVNYGIRIKGVKNPFNVNTFRDYYANRFDVTFSDRSTVPVIVTESFDGVGVYEEVAMNEYLSWGFIGQNHMLSVPPQGRDSIVPAGGFFGVVQIRWADQERDLLTTGNFKGSVLIYCELTAANPATLTAARAGGVFLSKLIANVGIAADGLTLTSLNE